jgi:hypothetical protein
MRLVSSILNFTKPQQKLTVLSEVKAVQNFLSKYAFTKDQHLGFEAAA